MLYFPLVFCAHFLRNLKRQTSNNPMRVFFINEGKELKLKILTAFAVNSEIDPLEDGDLNYFKKLAADKTDMKGITR